MRSIIFGKSRKASLLTRNFVPFGDLAKIYICFFTLPFYYFNLFLQSGLPDDVCFDTYDSGEVNGGSVILMPGEKDGFKTVIFSSTRYFSPGV
jgi:hypothetical protein